MPGQLLQSINRTTEIIECQHSKVDLDRILGLQSFDLEKILSMDPAFLKVGPGAPQISFAAVLGFNLRILVFS